MQRGRGGRDNFVGSGDPFAGFGGFGDPRSLMSSFFSRDPFDDPFFTRPFGSMFGSSMFGPSVFGPGGNAFGNFPNDGFLEHQPHQVNNSKGPVIEELSSDDEEDKDKEGNDDHPRKHSKTSEAPFVQDPDDEIGDRKSKYSWQRSDYNRVTRPQAQNYSFMSSSVTYGGANGAYYTSSRTRRMGGDGVMVEEEKEADKTTGKATHRISKGIHDRGHSVTRKLNPDGNVDTIQTLHNLNEDELPTFQEAWQGSARNHLPGWNAGFNAIGDGHAGTSRGDQNGRASRGWALPSVEASPSQGQQSPSQGQQRPRRVNIPVSFN